MAIETDTGAPQFGVAITADTSLSLAIDLAVAADAAGLDLIGVPDHPYLAQEHESLTFAAWLLAHTSRVRVFSDVAHLPLRPPAMLAKTAATLDVASGGRFELGLGAGGSYAPSGAMGGEDRPPADLLEALADAVAVIRAYWTEPSARHHGRFYSIDGIRPGPQPAHPIGIWIGAIRPRLLRLTGAISDGWAAPLPRYLSREHWPRAQELIDEGARGAGRDPRDVRRIAQLPGSVTAEHVDGPPLGHEPEFHGDVEQWIDGLTELGRERFDTFVLWPRPISVEQIELFAREVAPAVRERLVTRALR